MMHEKQNSGCKSRVYTYKLLADKSFVFRHPGRIIKNSLLTIIILSFFLLFSNAAIAQEDFKASTVPLVGLCPCSNQAYTVIVENTGIAASSYRVLANEDLSGWVKFIPNRFALNPGQKESFSVIVNSECNIEDTFDLEIFIATNAGSVKSIKQQLKILECYDYSLEQGEVTDADDKVEFIAHDNSYELCKNEQKAIPVLITNNEDFTNTYKIKMDAPEWASLSAGEAKLNAKKSGVLLINYDTANIEGKFKFKIDAISRLGEVSRKKSIEADVEECYSLGISIEKDKDIICGGEKNTYEAAVENSGSLSRNIAVDLEGPKWADIGNISSFYLESGSKKAFDLEVNPENDVSGSFIIGVFSADNGESDLRFSDAIALDVVPSTICYQAEIDAKSSATNFYNRDFIFAKVKNNGIRDANYSISLGGPSWVNANPKNLELKPGQSGNVNLEINPGSDTEESTFDVKLNVEINGNIYSKDIKVSVRKESEFAKKLKSAYRFYQYYIYLLLIILGLSIIFRKQIGKARDGIKKRYEKYKARRERLSALRAAREEREGTKKEEQERRREEKRKDEERKEEGIKKEEIKRASKKVPKKAPEKFSPLKILIYALIIIAVLVFIGHQSKLFNAKYLHIYISNFFVSYLYYILIGIGAVVALFLLFLLYNFVAKRWGKKSKVKKESKKEAKKLGKKKGLPYFKVLIWIIIAALIVAANARVDFGIFENIQDFFVLYQNYFLLGITILIAIIFLIRFYKPLFKFLRE